MKLIVTCCAMFRLVTCPVIGFHTYWGGVYFSRKGGLGASATLEAFQLTRKTKTVCKVGRNMATIPVHQILSPLPIRVNLPLRGVKGRVGGGGGGGMKRRENTQGAWCRLITWSFEASFHPHPKLYIYMYIYIFEGSKPLRWAVNVWSPLAKLTAEKFKRLFHSVSTSRIFESFT